MRRELGRLRREVSSAHRGILRANLWAESAARTAEHADEKAMCALDVAETMLPRSKPSRLT
jgi:hypothetical protein